MPLRIKRSPAEAAAIAHEMDLDMGILDSVGQPRVLLNEHNEVRMDYG